ncbi:MAG: transcriptional repressor [Phycisphaerales bacterium]|nr:transcriptional repressor [Phycisphaerales bacterium]
MAPDHAHLCKALSEEELTAALGEAGVRVTRHRTLIYLTLAKLATHPTADELHDAVHAEDTKVSLATVYNTLETLTELGLVRRIAPDAPGQGCRFDAEIAPHVHMVMPDGCVSDVPDDLSEEILGSIPASLLDQLAKRMGVRINGIKIDLSCTPGR